VLKDMWHGAKFTKLISQDYEHLQKGLMKNL